MAEEDENDVYTLDDYLDKEGQTFHSSIRLPDIQARNFEIKPVMIQLLGMMGTFEGNFKDDPNEHLTKFIEVCENFKQTGVTKDALRLRLFPMSLSHKAKTWLNSLPEHSIKTWDDLVSKFKGRFIPRGKRATLRGELLSFEQHPDELFYEAWERFKDMWRNCPNHEQKKYVLMEAFWNGLNDQTVTMLNTASNGGIGKMKVNELYELYEEVASSTMQQYNKRRQSSGRYKEPSSSSSRDIASQLEAISKRFDNLELQIKKGNAAGVHALQAPGYTCDHCNEEHHSDQCPYTLETVNYMNNAQRRPQGSPYSQTYNPNLRNHPNFSWRNGPSLNPPQILPSGAKQMGPPGFHGQPQQHQLQQQHPQKEESKIEKMFAQLLANQESARAENKATFSLHETAIKNLEVQMGQLASQMNVLTRSSLPSDTIPNPKRDGNEECKAISLRSGKQLPDIQRPSQTGKDITNSMVTDLDTNELSEEGGIVEEEETKKRKQTEENLNDVVRGKNVEGEMVDDKKRKTTPPPATQMPPLPFPQRFRKKDEDVQFKKFVDMFKQLHINIPFAEALEQMPKYAKFLKDVLSKKKRFGEFETVALTEDCSAILQRKLPPKLRDPGSFYIPCNIGKHFNGKALCDLGASVNLMPLAVFNRLNLGEARPTTVTLLFADRSISYPKGIVEDVLVKVDKFIFPADFIVLDCEVDWNIPIILGRPFLATARTLIDVEKGEITMRVNDEKVIFNMNQALKFPDDSAHCNCIDVIDSTVQEELINSLTKDPLEALLIGETSSIDGKVEAYAEMMSIEAFPYRKAKTFEPLDVTSALSSPLKPSVDEPPVLELKTLPSHLKYAYLGNSTTLPVIVSSQLSTLQEEKC
ncbi:uncharacterized protein LOC114754862 [Neltuma alba]|uniref:uncharacterized protein LOC114754862 n=1 Tax=Neltuma alba TaxID=207710 RepID=UPI0010A3B8EA|nr:uncharacterized protein LOC114754862 [Prosopis alba]